MASKTQNIVADLSEIDLPDTTVSARDVFDLDIDMEVPAFTKKTEHVPDLDDTYCFDHDTTLAILVAGFAHNRRVMDARVSTARANRPMSNRSPPA